MTKVSETSRFSVPRTTVAARLLLGEGDERAGMIFLIPRASQHTGPETPLDLLNRPEPVFPFRVGDGDEGEVLLVTKAQTRCLTVASTPDPDDDERVVPTVDVEVVLSDGASFVGSTVLEMPASHSRLLDFLNAVPDPFFAVTGAGGVYYINRNHVLYVRPRER